MRSKKGGGDPGVPWSARGFDGGEYSEAGVLPAGGSHTDPECLFTAGRMWGALRAECSKCPLDGGGWGDGCGDRKGVGGTLATWCHGRAGRGGRGVACKARELAAIYVACHFEMPSTSVGLRAEYNSRWANRRGFHGQPEVAGPTPFTSFPQGAGSTPLLFISQAGGPG